MTNHMDIQSQAIRILRERGSQYGNVEACFDRTAKIASLLLNVEFTSYEIAMVHVATKMARLQESRSLDDNYVDAMNYLAIAAQFAPTVSEPVVTSVKGVTMNEPTGIVEDDIAEIAKRFAPVKEDQPG